MEEREIGVHRSHCCVLHGCKYGEHDICPVENSQVKQDYVCEWCWDEGINDVSYIWELSRVRGSANFTDVEHFIKWINSSSVEDVTILLKSYGIEFR